MGRKSIKKSNKPYATAIKHSDLIETLRSIHDPEKLKLVKILLDSLAINEHKKLEKPEDTRTGESVYSGVGENYQSDSDSDDIFAGEEHSDHSADEKEKAWHRERNSQRFWSAVPTITNLLKKEVKEP